MSSFFVAPPQITSTNRSFLAPRPCMCPDAPPPRSPSHAKNSPVTVDNHINCDMQTSKWSLQDLTRRCMCTCLLNSTHFSGQAKVRYCRLQGIRNQYEYTESVISASPGDWISPLGASRCLTTSSQISEQREAKNSAHWSKSRIMINKDWWSCNIVQLHRS